MTERSNEKRIIRLEESLMHNQHEMQQLSEVIFELRKEVDTLRGQVDRLEGRLTWLMSKNQGEDMPHEKPPHY